MGMVVSKDFGSLNLFSPSLYCPEYKEHSRSYIPYREQVTMCYMGHKLAPGPSAMSQLAWQSQYFAQVEVPPMGIFHLYMNKPPYSFPLLSTPHHFFLSPAPWLL